MHSFNLHEHAVTKLPAAPESAVSVASNGSVPSDEGAALAANLGDGSTK